MKASKILLATCIAISSLIGNPTNASDCNGKIINPITDVCWSCVFPIKLAGATLVSGKNPDPSTDANHLCMCISGANITIGLNMSFWEPLRTAEIVRHPYCFPSLGGLNLNVGLRAPAHGRTPKKTDESGRSSFYQVHWYFTPWLFVLQALLDTACLEQSAWDLAYMTELDPLWDDSVTTFFLNPDVSLFANIAANSACAADCVAATTSLPSKTLYWCGGCNGNIFPLAGWVGAHLHLPQASSLLAMRFLMKLHRQGLEWAAYGEKGQCGPYLEPVMDKSVYRSQMVYPSRTTAKVDGRCCYPIGASTALWSSGKTWAGGGEDAAYLIYRKRDCCQGSGLSSL
ncbi:MAG: TraU family protein [Burkholderiales bacterium]|nr:TraU family protein [Burkholderiales bacterium]